MLSYRVLMVIMVMLLAVSPGLASSEPEAEVVVITAPQNKFDEAYQRLIEAKELWLRDQDSQARELLAVAWSDFNDALKLTSEAITNSPQAEDARQIVDKISREAKTVWEDADFSWETVKETAISWLESN